VSRFATVGGRLGTHRATLPALAGLTVHTGGDGLILGRDQRAAPVLLRLFRPEPTTVLLVGGLPVAQLLAMRTMALGAQLLVVTTRPAHWESFVRTCGARPDRIALADPGAQPPYPARLTRPQLIVVDIGSTVGQDHATAGAYRATLVVRDELTAWDTDALVAADAVVMQQLTDAETGVAAAALQLSSLQGWFARIPPEMVALAGQGRLRWALLSPTSVERSLFHSLARFR
jgi:hypothetical protein